MSYEKDAVQLNTVVLPNKTAQNNTTFSSEGVSFGGEASLLSTPLNADDKSRVPLPAVAGIAFSVVALLLLGWPLLSLWLPEALLDQMSFQLALNAINQIGIFAGLPLLILVLTQHKIKDVLRLNKPKVSEVIISAALPLTLFPVVMALAAIVMLLVEMVFGSTADLTGLSSMMSETNIFVMIIFVAVMPAICEEVLFRGVVLKGLQKNGIVFGIILTAILFGLFHMDFQRFIAQALMGAVAGVVVYRTNSIFCGMIVHFMNNFVVLMLSFVAVSFIPSQEVAETAGETSEPGSTLEALRASAESANVDVIFMVAQTIIMFLIIIVVFAGLTLPLFIALFHVSKGKVQRLRAERELYAEKKPINLKCYLAFVPGLLIIGYSYYLTALYLLGLTQ
ncbi:MAG: CPBP family intramembrane metalloprotease [Peptococcaceae bacterium]|nr:CPBP family intramembrane metalloprotease [Peptococcaceae bacterium]